jgi:WD40 repeat protein
VADPAHPRLLPRALTVGTAVYDNHSAAFSPDGRILASNNDDGTVHLWDVAGPSRPGPLGQPLTVGTSTVYSVAFSLSGHTLATGDGNGAIRLWNAADPAHARPVGQPMTSGGAASTPWRSALCGTCSRAATVMARSGCGTLPIPRTPGPSASP